jgi:hypothetical protein
VTVCSTVTKLWLVQRLQPAVTLLPVSSVRLAVGPPTLDEDDSLPVSVLHSAQCTDRLPARVQAGKSAGFKVICDAIPVPLPRIDRFQFDAPVFKPPGIQGHPHSRLAGEARRIPDVKVRLVIVKLEAEDIVDNAYVDDVCVMLHRRLMDVEGRRRA